jgi:hypothetical protein
MYLPSRQETLSSISSGARHIFTRRPWSENNESDNENKGPLGLTTVYNPPLSAIADLIFVHGLGGGSRSTWCKNNDPSLFWPQEWLSSDAKFEDVRIYTFGYNSKLGSESILNINDFAKSLLGAIYECPFKPGESDVSSPICILYMDCFGIKCMNLRESRYRLSL